MKLKKDSVMEHKELEYGPVWIYDNFLSQELLDEVKPELDKLEFQEIDYGYRADPEKELTYDKQLAYLVNGSHMIDVLKFKDIRDRVEALFKQDERLDNKIIRRVHLSKISKGDPRHFHIDSSDGEVYVAVMFLNNEWQSEWDGDLVIQNKGEEIRVEPKPGRLIIFNGRIVHRGGLVSQEGIAKYTLVCKIAEADYE